jgi:threonine aldolase
MAGEAGMIDVVDLRSDTVTRPSAEMRRAMAEAEVGDDQLGDDPTTARLEARVAELLGKERALFFPTGIMANQTALAVHAPWASEVIVEADSHLVHWEDGAAAAFKGLQLRPVATSDGIVRPEHLSKAVRPESRYQPRTGLVCIENTHLAHGGRVVPTEAVGALADAAHERGLPVHLDGARLWHACAATGDSPAAFAKPVDSVMVALSKGLGAPVGSLLAGTEAFIDEAWRVRRRLGGSMRQSGHLAAAGLVAVDQQRARLVEDYQNAKRVAAALGRLPGVSVIEPATNVVLASFGTDAPNLSAMLNFLAERRILMLDFGGQRLRAVTHLDIGAAGVERVERALEEWQVRRD